jgi:hypothetical protein
LTIWEFEKSELETFERKLQRRLEKAKYFGNFSLKPNGRGAIRRLEEKLAIVRTLLENEPLRLEVAENLKQIEGIPLQLFYQVDRYSGKSRLVGKVEEERRAAWEVALSLIAQKIGASLTPSERGISRDRAVGELIRFLENRGGGRRVVIRGDFKSYTLNIPRPILLKVLEERGIPAGAVFKFIKRKGREIAPFAKVDIPLFFEEVGYGDRFKADPEFKAILNKDGLPPGTPLTNLLGQIFLLEFDKKLKELAGPNGFAVRYFDDFILIRPLGEGEEEETVKEELRREIEGWIVRHYQIAPNRVGTVVEFEEGKEGIEFLGYLIRVEGGRVKSRIRYKTLRKFLYKYLYDYSFSNYRKRKKLSHLTYSEAAHYLISKLFYLYQWMDSFIYLNDPKLLDKIYTRVVLPDLYTFLKKGLHLTPAGVKKGGFYFKPYFRLTTIHRRLKQ